MSVPLACIEMKSIYHEVLKLNEESVMTMACFKALFPYPGYKTRRI